MKGSSKRKRTREELEEVKQEEDFLKDDRQLFLQEFKRLRKENEELAEAVNSASALMSINTSANASKRRENQADMFNI